jgi:hypothetical protein
MRTLSTLLFLVLSTFSISGQTWPAEGSEWYYCKSTGLGIFGYDVYTYTNDSLINDTAYSLIRPTFMTNAAYSFEQALENDQITLVRQSNDTIYRRVEETEHLFFIHGLEVGDGFTTFRSGLFFTNIFSCSPELELEVVEIEFININGEEFRIVSMQDMNFSSIYNFEIIDPIVYHWIESIGLQFDFPYFNFEGYAGDEGDGACDQTVSESLELELYQYVDDELNLELVECSVSATRNQKAFGFKIYPNPSQDFVQLEGFETQSAKYGIIDLSGRSIQVGILRENRIDVSSLLSGIYFLRLELVSGEWGSEKLVIE